VGGDQDEDRALDSGAVYVFQRAGTVWQQEVYLKASSTGPSSFFGRSVALSGDTLAIGSHGESDAIGEPSGDPARATGAVYVFRRAGTAWQQEAYLEASNADIADLFGWSVALSGDTLAVTAPGEDSAATGLDGEQSDSAAEDSGAVYIFHRTGTTWQQRAYVKPSITSAGDSFGWSVALSDDTLAVGARFEDSAGTGVGAQHVGGTAPDSGAVYLFH